MDTQKIFAILEEGCFKFFDNFAKDNPENLNKNNACNSLSFEFCLSRRDAEMMYDRWNKKRNEK